MKVNLNRSGNLIEVDPWVPALEGMLSFRRVVHEFGGRKTKTKFLQEKLYTVENGKGLVPAGMYSRVYNELAKHHTVEVNDYRDMSALAPVPDFTRVDSLRPGQDKILLAVAGSDGGLIVGGTGAGKSFCIKQICLMYPTLKIVILSPRVSVVNTIYDSLTAAIPATAVARLGGGRFDKSAKRITVATTKSMLKCDLKNCDLLLVDECHCVGMNQVAENLAYAERARKFGFSATVRGRGDGADIMMEAIFGPKLTEIDYEEAVDSGLVTPIEVRMISVPTSGYVPDSGSQVSWKRWSYWRNGARNSAIARAVQNIPADKQILIMVETLEHALYIKKLLPDFELVHYGSIDKDRAKRLKVDKDEISLSKEDLERMRKDFSSGKLKRAVSTMTWKEGVDFPQLEHLIRADGSPGDIPSGQIPGRLSRLYPGKEKGVLIDFDDSFSPRALSRSHKRVAAYRRMGWAVTTWQV